MNFRKSVFLSLAVVAFAAPGLSSATSLEYPAQGDSVGPFPQEHFQSTKTRAEVMRELEVARQGGTLLTNSSRDYPFTKKSLGSGKTRAEVQSELLSLSAEEKKRMHELYRGGR